MTIFVTSKFKSAYKHLTGEVKEKAKAKEELFKENPFHPLLKTHRLHGKFKNYWAFSVDTSYRIMFQFLNTTKTKAVFINMGTHKIYK